MNASTLMKKPICLSPNHIIDDALVIMDAKRFNHLPITKDGKVGSELVGMIARKQIAVKLGEAQINEETELKDEVVSVEYLESLNSDSSIKEILKKLSTAIYIDAKKEYLSALPVTKDNLLEGILSYKDILRKMEDGTIDYSNDAISSIMATALVTVLPEKRASMIYSLILNKGYRTFPVVESEESKKLVGLVTDMDVFNHLQINAQRLGEGMLPLTASEIKKDVRSLSLATPNQTIKDILPFFLKAPYPTAILVVNNTTGKELVGLISYVDIFREMCKKEVASQIVETKLPE